MNQQQKAESDKVQEMGSQNPKDKDKEEDQQQPKARRQLTMNQMNDYHSQQQQQQQKSKLVVGGSKTTKNAHPLSHAQIDVPQAKYNEDQAAYISYLQQKQSQKGSMQSSMNSALGMSLISGVSVEDVVKAHLEKKKQNETPFTYQIAGTKLSTYNDNKSPSVQGARLQGSNNDYSQFPQAISQLSRVNDMKSENEMKIDISALDVKSFSKVKSTHEDNAILKNEILRNTQYSYSFAQGDPNDNNERSQALHEILTKKQFDQQQQMQLASKNKVTVLDKQKQVPFRKDGKDISDLLQYKDYTLDYHTSKLSMASTKYNREENSSKLLNKTRRQANSTFVSQERTSGHPTPHSKVIRNTYHPSQIEQMRKNRPKSLIKIPDEFMQTMKRQLDQSLPDINPNSQQFHITDLLDYDKNKTKHSRMQQQQQEVLSQGSQVGKDDKEFVIKNYRVIQKQKREFFLPQTTKHSPERNTDLGLQSQSAVNSPIRVSNSILSPNTFHYSTRLGPTTDMKWSNLAQIPLHKTNQRVVINTLLGISKMQEPIDITEFELEQRPNIMEENYKDVMASWLGNIDKKSLSQNQDLLQRQDSVSKIYRYASSDSIEVEKEMIMKLKPQHQMYREQILLDSQDNRTKAPNESYLNSSRAAKDDPYGHLKARNVFKEKADVYQKCVELTLQVPDTKTKVKMIIELSKDFLTHMEKQHFSADRLPLELFDDFIQENERLKKKIDERRQRNRSPLKAKSYYFILHGECIEADAKVLEYDSELKKFLIEFQSGDKILRKYAGRLNLHFIDLETKEQIQSRRDQAKALRKDAQSKLNSERLFMTELAKKYDYIRLPKKFKENIKRKLVIDLKKYDQEKVKLLVIQIEALFVFSILKSIIASQIGDPFINRIVAQYRIEETSYNENQYVPTYALKSYEENGGEIKKLLNKQEARLILQDYSIVGKKSFIDAIQYLIQQNEEIIVKSNIFEFPIPQNLLVYMAHSEEFQGKTIDKLKVKLREFPIQMHNFVKSQRVLAKRFREALEVRWTENIAKKLEKIVDKEFDQNSREITRKTLNPYVLKLFELIRLFQEKNLYDKLLTTLENYLKYLLKFAIRVSDFVNSAIFTKTGLDQFQIIMSSVPMIQVQIKVRKQKIAEQKIDTKDDSKKKGFENNRESKSAPSEPQIIYSIYTSPHLADVWQDFNGLTEMFINSVSRVKRIDEMVIPQLKLKKNTLRNPDVENDAQLKQVIRMIQIVIDNLKSKPDQKLEELQQYLHYLGINFDQLILDLKRRSYEDQRSNSDIDSSGNLNVKKNLSLDHDEEEMNIREKLLMQEAYKNIDISEVVYLDKFEELRNVYWNVQIDIESIYDYGIVFLDCVSFKELIVKHVNKLVVRLTRFVTNDFLQKMSNLYGQYETIEIKASNEVHTIDEVIHLIDYIEKIQKSDDLLDELENYLDVVKNRKDFIDTLQLKLTDDDFNKYLKLFSYPSRLKTMLLKRKQALETERNILSEQMNKEKDKIMNQLSNYKERLDVFKNAGLYQLSSTSPEMQKETSSQSKIIIKKEKSSCNVDDTVEQKKQLFKRTSIPYTDIPPEGIFVPTKIIEMADQMEILKAELEATEQDCETINRREKLLNMRITKFSAVQNLQTEIKPFIQLWQISASYTRVYDTWLDGQFYELNSDQIEENINEWWKQLTRISKSHISQYEQPMNLLNYLVKQLGKFKDYMPMVTALRSKGLEKRHWQLLSKQLGFEIDPNQLTLQRLIDKNLFEGQKLDVIKGVSEIAIKEYAIKTTLDALDNELRIMEFQPMRYKETQTFIIKGIDELITAFEESSIKILALKSNSYAKHFMDKIMRVEKELKIIVDVLDEWVKAQKSWVYLEPIFQQQDIAKQMLIESAKFISLDHYYKKEMSHILMDSSVQRYCRKEGLLSQLQYVNKEFENITRGLSFYLEAKREYFARFYFLSNEEIIEILGQMREPRNVQRYLNKIFEGIDYLGFLPNGNINGIYSKEDEYIQLRTQIKATESAENWLKILEQEMKEAVRTVIQQSVVDVRMKDFDSWVKSWQGQIVLVVMNIISTETLTDIFNSQEVNRLKDVLKQVHFEIESLTKMIRTKLDHNTRTTICSCLTNRVHARDSLKRMIDSEVQYASDFLWKMHMKYNYELQKVVSQPSIEKKKEDLKSQESIKSDKSGGSSKSIVSKKSIKSRDSEKDKKIKHLLKRKLTTNKNQTDTSLLNDFKNEDQYSLTVEMIDAQRQYGYEYLGNTQRIVITPLTDRCYRALFMALHFNYGGSPEGPVGTGKTETTKDLSKCLAKQCFVFNCSSSLNYVAMTKFFKGLATSGAWSCFDEFNRIELSVLSVISQIIIIIQGAIRENKQELMFEDSPIQFNKDCAIFITMNPQYIGRTELPDNLKSLFRPVAMIVPDSILISEILLYSFGFLQAKPLARKIVRTFNLAKQQLSNQIHYDFGLRSIKIVLQIAGLMKLKASGVIEPDFKIKESKIKKKKDDENSPTKREGTFKEDPTEKKPQIAHQKSKFVSSKTKKSKNVKTVQKRKISILGTSKHTDSSLGSHLALSKMDGLSVGSSALSAEQNESFYLKSYNPNLYDEDDDEEPSSPSQQPMMTEFRLKFTIASKRQNKSVEKYSLDRLQIVQGKVDKVMQKRMEFLEDHQDEAKQTRKLMKVLGIEDENLIEDEEKVEEFIVLRAINDTNVPKLHQTDTMIFRGITDDIFPKSIQSNVQYGSLKNLIEAVFVDKGFQITDEIIQRTLHLYDSVMIRHGVMIVGSTMTGKTSSMICLQEALNRSRDNEVEEKISQYRYKKAKRLGLAKDDSSFEEDISPGGKSKAIDLTPEEVKMIKAQCRNKGVINFTINPKSITLGQLMGTYDEVSHDWNDGVMANVMRQCSQDLSERRKLIVFDGPIDPVWVENLNSVMDDNKKLTLSTGETIKMTGMMTIIIEAEDLTNCTPATISRCGMIYMKDDIIPLKAHFNRWLKSLPSVLSDCAQELDQLFNYFIPDVIDNFMHQSHLIYPVTLKWAIQNFCRYMNAMINDYRSEKFSSSNATAINIYNDNQNDDQGGQMSSKLSALGKRASNVSFADIETRFQNAQNFFLFSLVWSFGSILKINLRREFERHIKTKIFSNTEEISQIAQLKSKIVRKTLAGSKVKTDQNILYEPTKEFKEPEKTPYFLCSINQNYSLFEIFFDLETNSWIHWDTLKAIQKPYKEDEKSFKKKQAYFLMFVPTIETIRLGYIIEANIICKNNMLLIGPTGCGKSWLSREVIFKQLPNISSKYKASSLVFSNNSTAEKTQHFIDSRLERRKKGIFGPPFSHKQLFFIDDLMMPFKDEYNIQSSNELLRQWFDFGGWYDHRTLDFKQIVDIQFLSCLTVYESHKNAISSRNEWHWAYLGTLNIDERHYLSLFTQIMESFSQNWSQSIQAAIPSVIKATLNLYAYFESHVKPTPSKYLYIFNTRHMFKIIYGMAEVDPNYLKSEFELAKLWIHEAWRTLCDRIVDYNDKKILYGKFSEVARKQFNIGKNKLSKKIGYPFFCPFNPGTGGQYVEVTDMKETTNSLRKYLSDYNEVNKRQRINVVLFEFLVEFLIKIYRIIKMPFSHAILIGIEGSGKRSLSHLATYLANYQFYEIKLEATYSQEDWYSDLKNILQIAGLDQKEIVFHLKHNQLIKEEFLDDLNTIINNGEIQGIFTKEEYENIIAQTTLRLPHDSSKGTPVNNQLILAEFSQKCRENLKVLLNFTPTGANLRPRIRKYKSIVNCSTIVWMDSWPQEGYKEVAETILKSEDVINKDVIIEIAINMHSDTIITAKNYYFETQHYIYVTPHSFADFVQTYKNLFEQKRQSLKELQERYETGLERLKNTQDAVEKFQEQLENNSPMLIEKQIEIENLMEALKEEHEFVGKRRDFLIKEEQELKFQSEQADRIREECEFNLSKATPDLYSAIASLQNLSKNDISELKTLRDPPKAVKLLMEAVCILLKIEPVKVKAKDGVGYVKDYWLSATGKHVLGNQRLVEVLTKFDQTQLDTETMSQLEELVENPDFVFEKVARASKAGRGLFLWLNALKNYYYIYQETQPKRDALFNAQKQKAEKEYQIVEKRNELQMLEGNLTILKRDHEIKEHEIRFLQKQIDECSLKKDRATKLLSGLGGEKQKWLVCNRMIAKKFLTIQGDVLMGTALITYLSTFTQKYREQCIEKWEQLIRNYGIRITDDFNFNKIFGDQIKIKEWNFNGLPSDSFSVSNAIILENSSKQCICIDPQYQANKWIKLQERDLKVLSFSDVNFVQSFEVSMKFGKKVLIENVGQKIDLLLYPILRRDFVSEGGATSVNIFGHMVEMDKNFKLFITSEVRNPHFGPDISVMTNYVNFYVTLEGLEAQMLSIVISNQRQELEDESIRMKKEALDYIKILKKLENDILSSLHKDIEQILSDEQLIETLNNSKKTQKHIAENLQKVNKASTKILKSRGIYTPAAYRAALLYFLVSDLSKVEVMYQFSLKWYIEIFTNEVKQKNHTDQDPLLDIIRNFTYTLYRKVCQSIFEKDKLLFTFLLAFRILEGENCLEKKLVEYFIKGPQLKGYGQQEEHMQKDSSNEDENNEDEEGAENDRAKLKQTRCPWINELTWSALEKLSKIPPFHKPNLIDHIIKNAEQWQQFLFGKDGENQSMPGPYMDYDFESQARKNSINISKVKKKNQKDAKLVAIKEELEDEDDKDNIDDKIFQIDDEDEEDQNADMDSEMEDDDYMDKGINEEREQVADSLVMGVSEYNEFRLGSVRYEKEMQTKKQQVHRDLVKFCIIRCFRPEKIVREVQRFLGSVLDPRFMEPPVFNLPALFKETSSHQPILFILSPNINTLNELQNLKNQIAQDHTKIEYMPLGSNINERVHQLIMKAALQGNWLLLENLHLVTDWIPTLEKFIHTMYKEDNRESKLHSQEHSDSELDTARGDKGGGETAISQFPELRGCRISPRFRLWLSSSPVDYFPVSFLQECVKITLQPALGIRQNGLKILNSISPDFLYQCQTRQGEFRKLFFALCIFHSVVGERQRYGPIGWSQPYQFSENDFLISSLQLQSLIGKVQTKTQPLPLELIRYLIGTLNYGGRIYKEQDEIIMNQLLETFLTEQTTVDPQYRLTGLDSKTDTGIYYVPGEGDLNYYKMHIQKFPIQDRPEIFGLHENATITRATNEGKNLLERVFEFEYASKEMVKTSSMIDTNEDAHLSKYSTIKKRIQIIIEDLPELLDEELCSQKYPISYELCINTLITKEVQRFNMLLQVIYVSLKNTLKALEGVIHINQVLEDIYKALTYEYVPKTWFKYSYPTFKSLSLFLQNLKEKVAFIRSWLTDSHPYNYWLPGFFDQQSFLTMLLQQKARHEKISIDLLSIEYHILKKNFGVKGMPTEPPQEGCYIYGLWIEGASWNDEEQKLVDQDSRELFQIMPCMHLKVVKSADFEKKYMNSNYYQCPLYIIALRERLEGEYTQGIVTHVPIAIGENSKPGFWIKRGTALICQKEE